MNDHQHRFLSLVALPPARLTYEQAAWVLNFQMHDMPILVMAKLLKPLGQPPRNGLKFFAAAEIIEKAKDRAWLARATNAIHSHWRTKNRRKNGFDGPDGLPPEPEQD